MPSDSANYVESVPVGGHLVHLRLVGADGKTQWRALCGYAPSAPKAHFFYRCGWHRVATSSHTPRPSSSRQCKKCFAEAAKLREA